MFRHLLFVLLACATALAQTPSSQSSSAPAPGTKPPAIASTSPDQLPEDAVVISIYGVCANPEAAGPNCLTQITKQQFHTMIGAMGNPQQMLSNPVAMRAFAESYAEALAVAQAAEKQGADKDPQFLELMRLARVRSLADLYRRRMQQQYSTTTSAAVEAYYHDNQSRYEQVELDRIVIPRANPRLPREAQPQFDATAKKLAEDVHRRAEKGEDAGKLQIEAYQQLGLKPPLTTDIGLKKRGSLPSPLQEELFALKSGEVSAIHSDPGSYTIYKVRTHTTLPLERVKDEIAQELERKNLEAALQQITGSVRTELNDKYFFTRQAPKATYGPGRIAVAPPEPGQSNSK